MTNTVVIFASARSNGNTKKLVDWICNALSIDIIDLSTKNMSAYDYEHKNIDDDFIPVMKDTLRYEQIIFASPIYWYAASAQMKVFIDRTTDCLDILEFKSLGRQLRNKTCYVACSSASPQADSNFLNTFEKTFDYLGLKYGGYIHADCQNGYEPNKYADDVVEFIKLVKC